MRRLLALLLAALAAAVVAAGVLLAVAHRGIRALDPRLPSPEAMAAFAEPAAERPVRIAWLDTARQPMPRKLVLDPARDPAPDAPYTMSHPVFVLTWRDGRVLLVDAGMDREAALAFGRPLAWAGAGPIEPLGAAADRLRELLAAAPEDGLAIVFTHLHVDHVSGIDALCRVLPPGRRLRVWQRPAQAAEGNHTTRAAAERLAAAPCARRRHLAPDPAAPVAGFLGVFVIHAAGHTPGSQIVGAWVGEGAEPQGWLLAGDVANAWDGVRAEVPKPWAYRTFLVPESEARLQRVRAFLRDAAADGFTVLVSHDRRALEASSMPPWSGSAPRP